MKWFEIPEELIPKLRELQKQNLGYEKIVKSEDAVVMYGGMGDVLYLTFDGRVIIESWDDEFLPREAEKLSEAAMAIVIGAEKRNFPELLSLLPPRPQDAEDCITCNKSGWLHPTQNLRFICGDCGGLGWRMKE